jgi:hypothetical protein
VLNGLQPHRVQASRGTFGRHCESERAGSSSRAVTERILPKLDERTRVLSELVVKLAELLAGAKCQDRRKGQCRAAVIDLSAEIVILPILPFRTYNGQG